MKKILLTSVAVAMATFASNAAVHPYVSAHVGYTNPYFHISEDDDLDYLLRESFTDKFAYDVSGAFGVKFDLSRDFALRGEVEYDYVHGFVLMTSRIWERSQTVLANAYLDFKTATRFTPYIGAGIGYQFNHLNNKLFSNNHTTTPHMLAWQFSAGVAYSITNKLSIDLGYRFLESAFYKIKDDPNGLAFKNEYNQYRLGVNYAF